MALVSELFYILIWAISLVWGTFEIAPGLKRKPIKLHIVASLLIMSLIYVLDPRQFLHFMIFQCIYMIILMLIYRLSSFITAATAVLIYIAQVIGALIGVNIGLFALKNVFDFRLISKSFNLYMLLIYVAIFVLVIKSIKLMMRVFKNIVNIDRRVQRLIIISDVIAFLLFIFYQKYTFINLSKVIGCESFHQMPSSETVSRYMLISYIALTLLVMILILLINHLLITGNNLERYKYKAEVDPMTGVLSRDAGINYLKEAIAKAREKKQSLTLAYVDVNDLKVVNDKYGHKEGDRLLKYITEIVSSNLRDLDVIARLGGDEFMVIFKKCTKDQAKQVWKRIDDEFIHINNSQSLSYKVSASVGFTEFDPGIHKTVSSLLHEADSEMYSQKKKTKTKNRKERTER